MTDEPWIEWHGGECPVAPDTKVEVRYRDGATGTFNQHCDGDWDHTPTDRDLDIVAYRVVQP